MYHAAGQKQRHLMIRIKIVKKIGRYGCLSRFKDFFKLSFHSLRIKEHTFDLKYSLQEDLHLWGTLVVRVSKSDKSAGSLSRDRVCEEILRCLLDLEMAHGCSHGCHKITIAVI